MSQQLLPVAERRQTWQHARGLLPGRRQPLLAAAALLGAAVVGTTVPPLLGRLVDVVSREQDAVDLHVPLVLLGLAVLLQGLLTGLAVPLVAHVGEQALARLREQVVDRVVRIPLAQVEAGGSGDLVARVGGDTDAVSEAVRQGVPQLATAVLTVGLTVVGLAVLDPRLALAGLVAVPIHVSAARAYGRRSGPLYAAERAAEGRRAQHLVEAVRGTRTVVALLLGPRHRARVEGSSHEALACTMHATRTRNLLFARLNLAELIGTSSVLVVGTLLVRDGQASLGEATAAALYVLRLFDPVGALLGLLDEVQSAGAALARLVGVARLPAPAAGSGAVPADASVRVRGVGFGYAGGPPVLHDVDLDLAPGEVVAVVGASGAGKSTLAMLLAGVHAPTQGSLLLGGVPVGELGEEQLRRAVALVTQEVHVFSGTLAQDLRLARPDADDARLRAALVAVGAADLDLGADVGAGGRELSAVQAQQVALARLVLAEPGVVVLDEATADAGSAGARALERAAAAALAGRTALVVAHRLSAAAAADRVVVLDAGRVVEQGPHVELLAAGGAYARLWQAWEAPRAATGGPIP